MNLLRVENLTVRYGALTVVDGVSFAVEEGQWLMLAGPNGAGKSTVLSALLGQTPCAGRVLLRGEDALKMPASLRARGMGLLSQHHAVTYGFSVREIVRMGRYAHARGFLAARDATESEAAVGAALDAVGLRAQAGQSVLTLSGGELQRAFLAQLLAQNPSVLLLDEPANHLDPAYQKQVFSLLQSWLRAPGRAIVSVVHDVSLARAFGTHALLLRGGREIACGPARQALSEKNLSAAFNMDVGDWMRQMLGQWER